MRWRVSAINRKTSSSSAPCHSSRPNSGCAADSRAAMPFPIRFTSDFQLGVAARIARTRGRKPLILRPAVDSGVADSLPNVESVPSLVWIGGIEPLEHPEISKFANAVAASGREVFLQTNGKLFRRRVHEFQPSPRLRLAFRFA